MRIRNVAISLGAALALIACGGAPESTGSTSSDLGAKAHAGDAGRGHACKPPDGGISPCARGDGGDDGDGEADDQGENEGGDDQSDEGGRPANAGRPGDAGRS
jgi:hypothetical protein